MANSKYRDNCSQANLKLNHNCVVKQKSSKHYNKREPHTKQSLKTRGHYFTNQAAAKNVLHEYQFQSINVSVNFSKFADIHASVKQV